LVIPIACRVGALKSLLRHWTQNSSFRSFSHDRTNRMRSTELRRLCFPTYLLCRRSDHGSAATSATTTGLHGLRYTLPVQPDEKGVERLREPFRPACSQSTPSRGSVDATGTMADFGVRERGGGPETGEAKTATQVTAANATSPIPAKACPLIVSHDL
jgi:hypothetical protein